LSVTADVKFSEPEASPAKEGLDLFEFFGLLWRAKYFIIATVMLFAVGGAYKALTAGDSYTAKMVVASVGQTNSSALGQLGALVGIQQVTEDREFAQFQALLKSVVLAERLESRYGVMKVFFGGLWDPVGKRWVEPQGWRHELSAFLNRLRGRARWTPPTIYDLAEAIDKQVKVNKVKFSGSVYDITYQHDNREFAIRLLSQLYTEAEAALREERRNRTQEQSKYLRSRIESTPIVEYRLALIQLLSDQDKQLMLLDSNLPLATLVLDPPNAPMRPDGASIALHLFASVLGASVLSVIAVLLFHMAPKAAARRRKASA
jgi:LPS O-antigen subunit length determinant protein (WzzB/FepE family)